MSSFMEQRKRVEKRAEAIREIEDRIQDLIAALKITSDMRLKMTMQSSLRANRDMLKVIKDAYWKEEL